MVCVALAVRECLCRTFEDEDDEDDAVDDENIKRLEEMTLY